MKFETKNGTLEISMEEMTFLGREYVLQMIKEMQTINIEQPKEQPKEQVVEKKNIIVDPKKTLKPVIESESESEPEIKAPKRDKKDKKKEDKKKKQKKVESESESEYSDNDYQPSESEDDNKKFNNVDISKLFGNKKILPLPK